MKVLCAIDGSRHSRWALELLPRLCRASDSSLLLVHAVDVRWFQVSKGLGKQARDAMRHAFELAELGGRKLLESAKLKVTAEWDRVESKLLRGRPADVMARAAARERSDLIVIGSRGLTEFRPMLLGSVSRELLMKAPCPVMVVKKRVTALTRIIVGADGSRESWDAIEFLRLLPLAKVTHVAILTAMSPLPLESGMSPRKVSAVTEEIRAAFEEEARKLVTRIAGHLRRAGLDASGVVTHGTPALEIIKLAEAERADLIVVGARGRRSSSEYLIGSVSNSVVKYAPCSVLVFRR